MNIRTILAVVAFFSLTGAAVAQTRGFVESAVDDPVPGRPGDHGVLVRFTVLDADGKLPIEMAQW